MMSNQADIILASASPRRAELLMQIGWNPLIKPVGIDESFKCDEPAQSYCLRMAEEKSLAAIQTIQTDLPLITADTIVVIDDDILVKPKDANEALLTLIKLSGRTHQVYSSVCVHYKGQSLSKLCSNQVKMKKIDEKEIHYYISTGEPMDKAGAYGIQGFAAIWIEEIKGSYSSIMGLPLFETNALLNELKVPSTCLKTKG